MPVVVRATPEASTEERFQLLRGGAARPDGSPVLLGDPMPALGGTCWPDLGAETVRTLEARDERRSWHAAVVALAELEAPYPKTLAISLGNDELRGHLERGRGVPWHWLVYVLKPRRAPTLIADRATVASRQARARPRS